MAFPRATISFVITASSISASGKLLKVAHDLLDLSQPISGERPVALASGEPKLVVLDEDHVHKLLKSGHVSSWRFFRLSWSLFCSRRSRRLRSCRQREERRCKRNTEYAADH